MKENLDEKLIREMLQKGTEMKAPEDLRSQILQRWQFEEERMPSIEPVLPRLTWWILGCFFAGLFIWGFSKMSLSGVNSKLAILSEQVLENLEYSIVGFEGIVVPSVAVLVLMVLINTVLLRYQILQQRV